MITYWRWIFGLAFVPTALVVWADLDTSAGASFGARIVTLAIAYLGSLALTALVVGLAVWAWMAVWLVWDFMCELLGFRE